MPLFVPDPSKKPNMVYTLGAMNNVKNLRTRLHEYYCYGVYVEFLRNT